MATTVVDTVYGPNLELEFEAVANDITTFKEFGYTGNKLTSVDLYEDNTKTTQIFSKTLSYTGNRLTQTVITRIIDGATLTKTFAYSGNILVNITAS